MGGPEPFEQCDRSRHRLDTSNAIARMGTWIPCAAVLVLLPPSEGKTAPSEGASVALEELSFPGLTKARERVLNTVIRVSGGREATALKALGLSKGQVGELALNVALRD